ncbi:YoaK family protein [Frateuria hangzhouensis]|uniref:YoaK family protein n=1 Tax=Frateuria hangzhouensis TaxID=2995589 RepID=UPI002260C3DB|nr:YoaK family protein [Frateuria sp. STR12]MCX7515204.1 YoaK family protein [Frateuria sp. STR12]
MEHADARWLEWSLPALAWVGGSLDAMSYLALGHVFTANMTGNTVLLAIALGTGTALRALRSLLAVCGFALGVAAGTALLRGQAVGWSTRVNRVLLLEAVLLGTAALACACGHPSLPVSWMHALISMLGMVMGMQSAAVRQVHLSGVWTTFITGTLTEWVAGLVDRTPAQELPIGRVRAAVYATYGLAALVTAWLHQPWPTSAIVLPLLVLLVLLVLLGVAGCGAWRVRRSRPGQSA